MIKEKKYKRLINEIVSSLDTEPKLSFNAKLILISAILYNKNSDWIFCGFYMVKKRDLLENGIIIGHRHNRKDSLQRLLMSKFFLILHRILFFSKVKDPSCPYILSKNEFFVTIDSYLKFMVEGFWWGFIAICLKKNIQIYQVKINHRLRLSGQTNVFHLNKIPSIALRNIYGLIKLRFLKIN